MSDRSEGDPYGTSITEADYARRIYRGIALSHFNFSDFLTAADDHAGETPSAQRSHSKHRSQSDGSGGHSRHSDPNKIEANGIRSLLTLPPEFRDRIWRFVLGNLDNDPDSVQCRHYYLYSHRDLPGYASRNPRLCFGLHSAVKAGKFPSMLVINRQIYGEAAKLLYSGRSFTFCNWGCYSG